MGGGHIFLKKFVLGGPILLKYYVLGDRFWGDQFLCDRPLARKDVTRKSKLLESCSYHGARFEAKALIIAAITMRGHWSVPYIDLL